MVKIGDAPRGWKLSTISDKSLQFRFQISAFHIEPFWMYAIFSEVGMPSFGWLCSSSSSGSSVRVPFTQVRPVCLLEVLSQRKWVLQKQSFPTTSKYNFTKGGYCSKMTQTFSGTLLDFLIVSQYWLSSCCGKINVHCPSSSFVDTVGLLAVYTSAAVHCLYRYDLRSVRGAKTILHQLYAVVADYINAFVE